MLEPALSNNWLPTTSAWSLAPILPHHQEPHPGPIVIYPHTPPGCMACAGITKPSPQSGHVRRTVVPRSSLSARVAFINNLSPARPRPREPFLCLLRTLLPVDLSVPYRHPRCFLQCGPLVTCQDSLHPSSPRISRLPPRLWSFRSPALPRFRTLLHRNSLRRCLNRRRRRRPQYDEPDDFRPSDRGPCALGT